MRTKSELCWGIPMRNEDHAQALRLIEQAVITIQGRYHPGRPMFYAMERLHSEVRQAQREAERSRRPPGTSVGA